jgi:hypothetical protein
MALTRRLVKGQEITAAEHDANIDHFEDNPNGVAFPKTSGIGIKIDTDAPDWGWHDLVGNLHFFAGDANAPTNSIYSGTLKQPLFAIGDEGFINLHMPHDYVPNTDIYVHIHWSHNSLAVTTGAPTFVVEGTYAKGHNQAAFGVPVSVNITEAASTTRYQHMVTESQLSNAGGTGGLLDTADLEVDGLFLLRIELLSNTMDGGTLPFIHFVDVHYQSTGLPTKNKAPDFWT